jgi:hypothetical protein
MLTDMKVWKETGTGRVDFPLFDLIRVNGAGRALRLCNLLKMNSLESCL